MPNIFQLSSEDKDQLSELVNIGISHAGTALSVMLGRRVTISVPLVEIRDAHSVSSFNESSDDVTVSVLLRLAGGLDGFVFLYFPHEATVRLLESLSGKVVGDLRALNPYDRSIFQELGNVITGGMLFGLSKFLDTGLLHSVPDVSVDMGSAMFNSISATMISAHEEFLSLDVAVCVNSDESSIKCDEEDEARGRMYIFIGPEAVEKILATTRNMISKALPS